MNQSVAYFLKKCTPMFFLILILGILKTNWMAKHLNQVPAVAVVFIDLEWDAAEWNERKMECSARVQAVRGKYIFFRQTTTVVI